MPKPPEIGRIALTPLTHDTGAVILRGHRMRPMKDGWVLLYDHDEALPTDDLHDELCIVRTADHRVLCLEHGTC
jgi:hypothetical protein